MNLIKLEQVSYGLDYETIPEKGYIYINPNLITYVEKIHRRLSDKNETYVYVVRMNGGREIHISEECFNRIVGREMELPEGPEIYSSKERPKKPEINPGHPIIQMF